jgi:hypothetical protein
MIVGVDYSLTSPAITLHDGVDWNYNNITHYCISNSEQQRMRCAAIKNLKIFPYKEWKNEMERYNFLADWAINCITKPFKRPSLVVLEDYAYAGTGRVFHIAENTAILKQKMTECGLRYKLVPPTVIKKYATTKGNANKELMYEHFCKETNTQINMTISPKSNKIGNPTSDIVDSYYICKYGLENLTSSQ